MRLNLADLARTLPGAASSPDLAAHRAIQRMPEVVEGYVPPDLDLFSAEELKRPILLVAAPGAMGKSEAAKYLASTLNALYVDLSLINVGEGTLLGELFKALGAHGLAALQDDIKHDRTVLVLDSTDEARLRSGSENYFAFLRDLASFVNEQDTSPRILLLGRSDSIIQTQVALGLIDLPSPVLTLQPLTYEQSSAFIDTCLDAGGYDLHRTQPEPSSRLRKLVMTGIARAIEPAAITGEDLLASWPAVDTFLGYPPVLLALSERLKVPNPQAEIAKLTAHDVVEAQRQRGQLLKDIVEAILDRESEKVKSAVNESLGIREDSALWGTLYSRNEQTSRLLSLTGTLHVSRELPAHLDDSDRARYEELVATFLPDHPFVRGDRFANQVFSDYVRAWAITAPTSQLFSPALQRAAFLASLPPVGPFFAAFIPALTPAGERAKIPENIVGDAIQSNAMGSDYARAWYTHRNDTDAVLRLFPSENLTNETIELIVIEPSGILTLRPSASRLTVVTDYGVLLQSKSGEYELGPDLLVIADEIEIQATSLRVASAAGALGPSLLMSRRAVEHSHDLRIVAYAPGDLLISWPDPWHQWNEYLLPHRGTSTVPYALATQVVVAVRKILRSFRPSHDVPAVSADKVDRILVGNSEVAQSVLLALVDLRIVERVGNQYHLDLSQLGEYQLSWHDLQADNPHEALAPICQEIVNVESFRAAHLEGS